MSEESAYEVILGAVWRLARHRYDGKPDSDFSAYKADVPHWETLSELADTVINDNDVGESLVAHFQGRDTGGVHYRKIDLDTLRDELQGQDAGWGFDASVEMIAGSTDGDARILSWYKPLGHHSKEMQRANDLRNEARSISQEMCAAAGSQKGRLQTLSLATGLEWTFEGGYAIANTPEAAQIARLASDYGCKTSMAIDGEVRLDTRFLQHITSPEQKGSLSNFGRAVRSHLGLDSQALNGDMTCPTPDQILAEMRSGNFKPGPSAGANTSF
jgi:hypothetical protein